MTQFTRDLQADIASGDLRVVSDAEWRAEWQARCAAADAEAQTIASAYNYNGALLLHEINRRIAGGWGTYRVPVLRRALAIADARQIAEQRHAASTEAAS